MKTSLINIAMASVAILISSCNIFAESKPDDTISTLPVNKQWKVNNVHNPIIKAGDFIHKGLWSDPSVIKEGNTYVMYMTSSVNEPFKPPILPFRAISSDGINWKLKPSKPLLDAKGTPYTNIETPSVIKYRNIYHMYYSGIFPPGQIPMMAIGHATSKDGIHWVKDPQGTAVLSATGKVTDWNGFLVAEPGAVVYKDRIYLYFVATGARPGGNPPQLQVIAVATSTDGTNFDKPVVVLKQTDIYPAKKGFTGYSTPMAVTYKNKMHLFYDVAYYNKNANPNWSQVAFHHASSSNGIDFIQDKTAIFTREHMDWTKGGINSPSVLFEDGKAKMWFGGHARQDEFIPRLIRNDWKDDGFGIGYGSLDSSLFE